MKKLNRSIMLTGFITVFSLMPSLLPATGLTTVRVANGLSSPVYVTGAPGDRGSLFIVQRDGVIKILRDGALLPAPFLDIDYLVGSGGERGLLGLAFHPDYAENGYFYLNYTNNLGHTTIARYSVSANPDSADPNSAMILMVIEQPYPNHNGGMIDFGSDGYLYIGMGDGGSAGDPQNRAQSDSTLLGKLLRIDVDGGDPYSIPPDNPFIGDGLPLDEIWAKGMRNPWRFSFDRLTSDLYIADVGQGVWEEIDFQPAMSPGGENYGWRLKEGDHCYNPPSNCDPGGLIDPIHEYNHDSSRCSITGGYVYRGGVIPDLRGNYFFADYCSNDIWSLRYINDEVADLQNRTLELAPGDNQSIRTISSFGEDYYGELYICDLAGGELFKIIPANPGAVGGLIINDLSQPLPGVEVSIEGTAITGSTDSNGYYLLTGLGDGSFNISFSHPSFGDTLVEGISVVSGDTTVLNISFVTGEVYEYAPGDANMHNGVWPPEVIGSDVTYLVNYFRGLPENQPCYIQGFWDSADANGDCNVIGSDVTRLVNYFRGLIGLSYCTDYPPAWLSPDDVPAEAPAGWPNCE